MSVCALTRAAAVRRAWPGPAHTAAAFFATKAKAAKKKQADVKTEQYIGETDDEHLFNIYAAVPEDHALLPDAAYPAWLWELEKPDKSYGELVQTFVYGKVGRAHAQDVSQATMADYNRFCRLHNRCMIKLNNIRLQKRRRITSHSPLWDA